MKFFRAAFMFIITFLSSNLFAQTTKNAISNEFSMLKLSPLNNFYFLVPVLVWNAVFTSKLPMFYSSEEAPNWIMISQSIFRYAAFFYPLFIPLNTKHDLFIPGLVVYSIGLLFYFGSWIPQMLYPDSALSQAALMRLAPAYTPIIWLAGMSLMSRSIILPVLSTVFIGLHVGESVYKYKYGVSIGVRF